MQGSSSLPPPDHSSHVNAASSENLATGGPSTPTDRLLRRVAGSTVENPPQTESSGTEPSPKSAKAQVRAFCSGPLRSAMSSVGDAIVDGAKMMKTLSGIAIGSALTTYYEARGNDTGQAMSKANDWLEQPGKELLKRFDKLPGGTKVHNFVSDTVMPKLSQAHARAKGFYENTAKPIADQAMGKAKWHYENDVKTFVNYELENAKAQLQELGQRIENGELPSAKDLLQNCIGRVQGAFESVRTHFKARAADKRAPSEFESRFISLADSKSSGAESPVSQLNTKMGGWISELERVSNLPTRNQKQIDYQRQAVRSLIDKIKREGIEGAGSLSDVTDKAYFNSASEEEIEDIKTLHQNWNLFTEAMVARSHGPASRVFTELIAPVETTNSLCEISYGALTGTDRPRPDIYYKDEPE